MYTRTRQDLSAEKTERTGHFYAKHTDSNPFQRFSVCGKNLHKSLLFSRKGDKKNCSRVSALLRAENGCWWRWRELNPRPVMALRQHLHVCFAYNAYRHATSPADGRYCDYSTIQNLVKCQWTNSFDQGAVVAASP